MREVETGVGGLDFQMQVSYNIVNLRIDQRSPQFLRSKNVIIQIWRTSFLSRRDLQHGCRREGRD